MSTSHDAMSAADQKFLGALETWLRVRPEILVLFRYPAAAGDKDFEFFSSFETLSSRIRQLSPGTSVIAFRDPQLTLRGIVDDGFVANCLSAIPDGAEFLVLEIAWRSVGKVRWSHWLAGETHAELCEALEDSRGISVAVGPYPPWLAETDDVIGAVVPDEHGTLKVGPY
jgi:hypothetical protein